MAALPLLPALSCNGSLLEPSASLREAGVGEDSQVFAEVHAAIATCSEDETARIWDADTGKCVFVLRGHEATVNGCCFTSDNALLATCSDDHTVKIWSLTTGECLHTLHGHTDAVHFATHCVSLDRNSLL